MPYEYKMVQIPPNVEVQAKDRTKQPAATYLQMVVNEQATQGFEFYRVDTIGVVRSPGCLAGLFGVKEQFHNYYVITFRRPL